MKKLRAIFLLIVAVTFCLGFRIFPGGGVWDIDNSSLVSTKIFIIYPQGTTAVSNNLPGGDSLFGISTVTVDKMMASILADYNGIAEAFFTLAGATDVDYTPANAQNHRITITLSSAPGAAAGVAMLDWSGGKIVDCQIDLENNSLDGAKEFIGLVAHEIGHCMGLLHPQETADSLMSYYRDSEKVRLQIDDIMGLIHLYSVDSSVGKESATGGFSCSRK